MRTFLTCKALFKRYLQTSRCYLSIPSQGWNTDQETCKAFGSELASIHDANQNRNIKLVTHGTKRTAGKKEVSIGLHEVLNGKSQREWRWIDDTVGSILRLFLFSFQPADYFNWYKGFEKQPTGPLKCAIYYLDTGVKTKLGKWSYVECDSIQANAACMQEANFEFWPFGAQSMARVIRDGKIRENILPRSVRHLLKN
jgi:hypothetical protein